MSVIRVTDVYKKFRVYYDKGATLKEKTLFKNRNRYEDRWVLKGISFELNKGEAIGLIGENGCGKSTMLKMLTRIMYPDQGTIEVNGRVSSLIELGAGFHPDMSGRENIYTNAAIFGLTKKEIDDRMEDIIEFSELGGYIDNPVRTYSSGMYMRLAFSVAINVDADILLIDEILAVGDTNFQAKCFGRLKELKNNGVTIVIVTHDTNTVSSFCNKAIWIDDGKVVASGKAKTVVDEYLRFMNQKLYEAMERRQREKEEKERQEAIARGDKTAFCFTVNSSHLTTYDVKWKMGDQSGVFELHPGINRVQVEFRLQPGENRWCFETDMPMRVLDTDPRKLCFSMAGYEVKNGVFVEGIVDLSWGVGTYGAESDEGGYWRWVQDKGEIVFEFAEMNEETIALHKSRKLQSYDRSSTRYGLRTTEITDARFVNCKGESVIALYQGECVDLEISYHVSRPSDQGYVFGMGFYTMDYECIYGVNTRLDGHDIASVPRDGKVTFKIKDLPLMAGKYILQVAIEDGNSIPLDYVKDYMHFDVVSNEKGMGTTFIKHDWIIE
ncbi:MAG: ABC transporter ATP-binding protein [Lachnospiraceae bacterium]|nr:ABC transporter ATP-binding protein [Lachnospiraceae bacterium]